MQINPPREKITTPEPESPPKEKKNKKPVNTIPTHPPGVSFEANCRPGSVTRAWKAQND